MKKQLVSLIIVWLILLGVSTQTNNLLVLSSFLALTAALPFIAVFLAMFHFGFFQAIEKLGLLKVVWASLAFVYLAYANKWAGDTLNDIFKVDPALFPATSAIITLAFGPIFLYSSSAWGWSTAIALLGFSIFLTIFLPAVLINPSLWNRVRGKHWVNIIAGFICVAIWMPLNSFLGNRYPKVVERIALWADFNDNHRCSNLDTRNAEKVVFLRDGFVLAKSPSLLPEPQYTVQKCTYPNAP